MKRMENRELIPILITIPNEGVLKGCFVNFGIFLPMVVKTKSYDNCKDLSIIRYKIENKMMLSTEECSLLVTLPLLETGEDETKLTEEFCDYIIHYSNLIPSDELENVIMAMFF